MDEEQATDERTFTDALNHLRESIKLQDTLNEGRINMFDRARLLSKIHDLSVKAYNTVAFLSEQESDAWQNGYDSAREDMN